MTVPSLNAPNAITEEWVDSVTAAVNAWPGIAFTTAARNALVGGDLWRGRTIFNSDTGGIETYYGATTLWRPPWNTAWGAVVAPAVVTANQNGITTAATDLTSLTVSLPATAPANRRYRITGRAAFTLGATSPSFILLLIETATQIDIWQSSVSAVARQAIVSQPRTPAAGAITYKLQAQAESGTINMVASATMPANLSIEDVGPVGNAPAA